MTLAHDLQRLARAIDERDTAESALKGLCKQILGDSDTPQETETETCDMIGQYVIVRTYSAGCFAGILTSKHGKEVVMSNARRLWYWAGAASLSQLAIDGTNRPSDCKFPAPVAQITLTEAIEILTTTLAARASIEGVSAWTA